MKHVRIPPVASTLALALLLAGCSPAETPAPDQTATQAPSGVVDSIFPMDVMLDRFRRDIPPVERVTTGADGRDALVEQLVRALAADDMAAFESLSVGLGEWAWLYYPTSAQALPPYELPPGLAWLQFQENNRTGVLRALERLGGHALDYRGYECDPEPTVEGENRIWVGCLVTLARNGEEPTPVRLFSAILERDGRFAFLSFANDF